VESAFLWLPFLAFVLFNLAFKFKTFQRQLLGKVRAEQCLQRTVCHVPFKGIFSLENILPFRGLVLVATRR
jgi:hypothetical protein